MRGGSVDTHVADSEDALVSDFADWLIARVERSVGPFAIASSGGSKPRPLYALLARPERARRVDWSRVHLFWGDERMVPHDHPDSNYRMAKLSLIDHVPIPAENVHPIPTDRPPEMAANDYALELRDFYGADVIDPGRPLFGVNLLGMGEDGHTASLFPGIKQLDETKAWAVAIVGVKSEPRISLTFDVLASAQAVTFLVAGASKAGMVERAWGGDARLPAGRVRADGELIWFLDRAAASDIDHGASSGS